MRQTFNGFDRYSGRAEPKVGTESPDLNKTPNLRKALAAAARSWPCIAESVGCKTKVLKSFARGKRGSLPDGVTGRVIDYMRSTL